MRVERWLSTLAVAVAVFGSPGLGWTQNITPRAPETGAKKVPEEAPELQPPLPQLDPPPPSEITNAQPVRTSTAAEQKRARQEVRRGKQGPNIVKTMKDSGGWKLLVDGKPLMVLGMNWDYFPVGTNYNYNFWGKPDDFIKKALDNEMSLMHDMGANAIRVYAGIPHRWIEYIYREHGIYTILNHAMGRYGHNIDGVWVVPTNYADPRTREVLTKEIVELVKSYKDTPGLLMWMLGNENNYGLYWSSSEIENLPDMDQQDARATFLYTLYGQITDEIHKVDQNHPVSIANGDLQFIDLIAKHVPNLDVMGSNVYRGESSGDLFQRVQDLLDLPFYYTEFGSDAYNAREDREDQTMQAHYVRALWQEIYEHSHGKGRVGNAIGGLTFQWTDGWWKYRQTENLDVHDKTASWSNQAYLMDWAEGQNNMNEEWFGVCAKGLPDEDGLYRIYPRAAFYVLREGYKLDPYATGLTLNDIRRHWQSLDIRELGQSYAVQAVTERLNILEMVRNVNLTMEFETFTTDGRNLSERERATNRFDHLESFYLDVGIQPTNNVKADVVLNVLGNVPVNPINEIFFEDRGQDLTVIGEDGDVVVIDDAERLKVYQAAFEWDEDWFHIEGFYRRGHYHWGYEGDFFHIYPEAFYEAQVDTFNANAPNGAVITGKKLFEGLKIAAGPELYWGANPTIIGKYHRTWGRYEFSLVHQEDIAQRANAPTSSVIPLPRTRKSSLYLGMQFGNLKLELGGLMAGTDRLDRQYTLVRDAEGDGGYLNSGFDVFDDRIDLIDTLGAKAKVTFNYKNIFLYAQGAYRGLVADSGWDPTVTFTGWSLREHGQGNNYNFFAGGAFNIGNFQIAPNFMYQQPLEGPLPVIEDVYDAETNTVFPGVTPRSLITDPFWVRQSRETIGFELLIAYDPTPATWMWAWDNVLREDAGFAAFIDFVYQVLPTSQDSGVGVADAGFLFAFGGAPPAQNLYEIRGRMIFNPNNQTHIVVTGYGGITQSTGLDDRLVERGGGDVRLTYRKLNLEGGFKVNDWGPYDFQRDFNLTFPLQLRGDVSYGITTPQWFVRAYTRLGVSFQHRIVDEFSPRFLLDPADPDREGFEWELRTYVHITL